MNASVLAKLAVVPKAYRTLVETRKLYDVPLFYDFEILGAEAMFYERENSEGARGHDHLQPFAKTAGGDTWCWTNFRVGPSTEPEILLIEDSLSQVVPYAPNFESFLYRVVLEDAYRIGIKPYEVDLFCDWKQDLEGSSKFVSMIEALRLVDAGDLAADLEDLVSSRGPKDSSRWELKLTHGEYEARVARILGDGYVGKEFPYSFLGSK